MVVWRRSCFDGYGFDRCVGLGLGGLDEVVCDG